MCLPFSWHDIPPPPQNKRGGGGQNIDILDMYYVLNHESVIGSNVTFQSVSNTMNLETW